MCCFTRINIAVIPIRNLVPLVSNRSIDNFSLLQIMVTATLVYGYVNKYII